MAFALVLYFWPIGLWLRRHPIRDCVPFARFDHCNCQYSIGYDTIGYVQHCASNAIQLEWWSNNLPIIETIYHWKTFDYSGRVMCPIIKAKREPCHWTMATRLTCVSVGGIQFNPFIPEFIQIVRCLLLSSIYQSFAIAYLIHPSIHSFVRLLACSLVRRVPNADWPEMDTQLSDWRVVKKRDHSIAAHWQFDICFNGRTFHCLTDNIHSSLRWRCIYYEK